MAAVARDHVPHGDLAVDGFERERLRGLGLRLLLQLGDVDTIDVAHYVHVVRT